MSVMVAHLFLIPIDGCSINPTRSFGPSLVAEWAGIPGTYYHQQSMFWFAPMTGAVIAAYVYGGSTLCNMP
jgi:glycerol uptake facilitator-like aquaporin